MNTSTGSTFTAFDKLQGAKNYIPWKENMHTVLQSFRQWRMVTGTVQAPVPADEDAPTEDETLAIEAFEVRRISAFMEISFRIADSAKTVLGNMEDPKVAWELLEKRYGAKQQGLQSVLMAKLQLVKWDGSGTIHTHRDTMVDIRTELADTGMIINDQSFYEYFTNSLPPSLNLFITLYDDSTYDIGLLCDKFSKYKMRRKLAAAKEGKADATSDV
jgi:gag-polypeptide of LTR copia-type